jgi:putative transposon-encoded protein
MDIRRIVSIEIFISKEKTIPMNQNMEKQPTDGDPQAETPKIKVKFEIYGEEMLEKEVKSSGNSGRVYLPPDWVGHHVKIVRID